MEMFLECAYATPAATCLMYTGSLLSMLSPLPKDMMIISNPTCVSKRLVSAHYRQAFAKFYSCVLGESWDRVFIIFLGCFPTSAHWSTALVMPLGEVSVRCIKIGFSVICGASIRYILRMASPCRSSLRRGRHDVTAISLSAGREDRPRKKQHAHPITELAQKQYIRCAAKAKTVGQGTWRRARRTRPHNISRYASTRIRHSTRGRGCECTHAWHTWRSLSSVSCSRTYEW